jgi:hypothetical protein
MHLPPEMLSRRGQPTRFNVVIMYEDFGTGKRAKKALDYVAEELGNDLETAPTATVLNTYEYLSFGESDLRQRSETSVYLLVD